MSRFFQASHEFLPSSLLLFATMIQEHRKSGRPNSSRLMAMLVPLCYQPAMMLTDMGLALGLGLLHGQPADDFGLDDFAR